jgi:predicted polyphosphate/ATP-dependent NAD kinase
MVVRVGLIVNPIAGMGGRVALKGTDGVALDEARARGAIPLSGMRSVECLREIIAHRNTFSLYVPLGRMGEIPANEAELDSTLIDDDIGSSAITSSKDTEAAARRMMELGVDIILFAGGDGTACDIYRAVGETTLTLGIPAGVKIHSAVFASSPRQAGSLVSDFIAGSNTRLCIKSAEVMDIDEDAYRSGTLKTKLCGYLRIPYERNKIQGKKSFAPESDIQAQKSIAEEACKVIEAEPDALFFIGAGTTTRELLVALGVQGTLLGVDAWKGGRLIATDISEREILELLDKHTSQVAPKIVITPIGGQGFIFGRGNQQFSPSVIKRVGKRNVILLASKTKLNALVGKPLLIDTGEPQLDKELEGYYKIISGYGEYVIYRAKQS